MKFKSDDMTAAEETKHHAILAAGVYSNKPPLPIDDLAFATFYALTAPGKRGKRSKDEEQLLRVVSVFVKARLYSMQKKQGLL